MSFLIILILTGLTVGSQYLSRYLNLPTDLNPSILLGLILVSGWVIGRSVKNKTLPMLTGFILYGMLVGPEGLNLITASDLESLEFIRFMIFMMMAFLAGGRLELKVYRDFSKKIPLLMAGHLGVLLLGTLLLFLILLVLFHPFAFLKSSHAPFYILFTTLVLASGSPAVVLSVNRENVSPVRIKALVLNTVTLTSMVLILPFLGHGVLLQAMTSKGPEWAQAFLTFAFHLFSVIFVSAAMGLLLRFFLKHFRGELIFFLIIFIIVLYGNGDIYMPELILSFMLAGIIVRHHSGPGKGFIKDISRHSLPFFVVFFTLTAAGIRWFFIPSLIPILLVLFTMRYVFLRFSTELILRRWREESFAARPLSRGFVSQSGLTLCFISIASSFPGISHLQELCTVLTLLVFLNLLIGPPLLQRALYRIKLFRET